MKRIHIHIGVENLEKSIQFYSNLFNHKPAKTKDDYAKWMLDDPCVNFAISTRSKKGLDHLGIQVSESDELEGLRKHMEDANISTHNEGETICCYAKSDKSWVEDPDKIAWEAYHTMEDVQIFSEAENHTDSGCCAADKNSSSCC